MAFSIRTIRTDNPEREIWRYLGLFKHESFVRKFVEDKKAVAQITSCLKQAEEIYALSKSVSMLSKPVLYYYGMQRLAKVLIFLKNPTIDLRNLKHHGLTGGGLSPNVDKFLESKIHVAKAGIFKEFSKLTTKNRVLLSKTIYSGETHHDESWVNDCAIPDFLESPQFRVGDLFLLIPEILCILQYLEVENNSLIRCHFSIRQHKNGKLDILMNVPKKLDLESLKKAFPELNEYKEVKESPNQFSFISKLQDKLPFPKPMVQSETGEYFLLNVSNNFAITDLNVHFLLMFILCHIARYKAPLLSEILEAKKNQNVMLIEKFIETSKTKFPKLILDEIFEEHFVFC